MPISNTSFLRACRSQPVDHTPVWFMRQAGRSLPEYRALRSSGSILDAVRDPDLATEITLQPVRRYGVDAAILFSDIVVPHAAIGVGIEIIAGRGPVLAEPFRSSADLARLRDLEPETDTPYVLETIRQLVGVLEVPLIGFAGAPFTIASYLIEGGPTRTFSKVKSLMHSDEVLWFSILDRLAEIALSSLLSQIDAGASAVQLFDSWAGALSRADYEHFVLPATTKVFDGLAAARVPRIHFGVTTGEILDLMAGAGADVVGVDWRVPLDRARARLPIGVAMQGNLDPALCLSGQPIACGAAARVLDAAGLAPGHIFNLGHGVLPETDPGVLAAIVDFVHEESAARLAPSGKTA